MRRKSGNDQERRIKKKGWLNGSWKMVPFFPFLSTALTSCINYRNNKSECVLDKVYLLRTFSTIDFETGEIHGTRSRKLTITMTTSRGEVFRAYKRSSTLMRYEGALNCDNPIAISPTMNYSRGGRGAGKRPYLEPRMSVAISPVTQGRLRIDVFKRN